MLSREECEEFLNSADAGKLKIPAPVPAKAADPVKKRMNMIAPETVTSGANEMFELAKKYAIAKDLKKELKEQLEGVEAEIKELNSQLVTEMVNADVSKFNYAGKLFYTKVETYVSAKAGDKPEFYQKLKDQGFGDIVIETVMAQTLKGFVKNLMSENNEEVPEWISPYVNVYEESVVAMRKG